MSGGWLVGLSVGALLHQYFGFSLKKNEIKSKDKSTSHKKIPVLLKKRYEHDYDTSLQGADFMTSSALKDQMITIDHALT